MARSWNQTGIGLGPRDSTLTTARLIISLAGVHTYYPKIPFLTCEQICDLVNTGKRFNSITISVAYVLIFSFCRFVVPKSNEGRFYSWVTLDAYGYTDGVSTNVIVFRMGSHGERVIFLPPINAELRK